MCQYQCIFEQSFEPAKECTHCRIAREPEDGAGRCDHTLRQRHRRGRQAHEHYNGLEHGGG